MVSVAPTEDEVVHCLPFEGWGVVGRGFAAGHRWAMGGKLLVGQQGSRSTKIVGLAAGRRIVLRTTPGPSGVSAESRVRPATTWGAQSGLR